MRDIPYLHRLLDGMMTNATVWVPHWELEWQTGKIVNITRAGTITVQTLNWKGKRMQYACAVENVRLEDPTTEKEKGE